MPDIDWTDPPPPSVWTSVNLLKGWAPEDGLSNAATFNAHALYVRRSSVHRRDVPGLTWFGVLYFLHHAAIRFPHVRDALEAMVAALPPTEHPTNEPSP